MKQGISYKKRGGYKFTIDYYKRNGAHHMHIEDPYSCVGIFFNVFFKGDEKKIKDLHFIYPPYTFTAAHFKVLRNCMSLTQSIVEKLKE